MLELALEEAKKLVNDKVITILKKDGPRIAFKAIHSMIPAPIRFVIKEEKFVDFCLKNQQKIFGNSLPTTTKEAVVKKQPLKKAAPKKVTAKAPVKKAVKKAPPKRK